MINKDHKCRGCKSTNLTSILDLGMHPWCNDFIREEEIGKEKMYPLHLVHCEECKLLQLDYTVSKETMFKDHTYVSSTTHSLTRHFLTLARENKEQFGLTEDDLIVDIGGNDGTQLLQFINAGLTNVLNVESADNIAQLAIDSGVPTINDFFNEKTVKDLIGDKSIKLINASGVFFHLEELHSVIKGIKRGLQDDGVFIVQFMYAGTMIEKLNFDGIYHEHLCYYTIDSLTRLLEPYGLNIFDAYCADIHSGSIIAKVTHTNGELDIKTPRYFEALEVDKQYDKKAFQEFSEVIQSKQGELTQLLSELKKDDVSIYAYGAPAKGNTLLNYFDITTDLVDKCVEINELKVGRYLPKSHIPIIKENPDDLPDYYLLLAHNFASEIINRNLDLIDNGLKFIVPFPEVTIVDKHNVGTVKLD